MSTVTETPDQIDAVEATTPGGFRAMPRWKRGAIIGAAAMVAVGLVLLPFTAGAGDLSTSQDPNAVEGVYGATFQGAPQEGEAAAESSQLAPTFLKLGFSFFVGLAIGYACRTFLKLLLIFAGALLIALFLLSNAQWVTVNWETMGDAFNVFVASTKDDLQAFHSFITGSLPQAGLASLGLVAGFKRN